MRRLPLMTMAMSMLAMPVRPEPGPIGTWLMNEPVTLWDRGMDRASEAASIAADSIFADNVIVSGSSYYLWDNNEINLHMIAWELRFELGHSECNGIRGVFIHRLVGVEMSDESFEERANTRIGVWFSHSGYKRGQTEMRNWKRNWHA